MKHLILIDKVSSQTHTLLIVIGCLESIVIAYLVETWIMSSLLLLIMLLQNVAIIELSKELDM